MAIKQSRTVPPSLVDALKGGLEDISLFLDVNGEEILNKEDGFRNILSIATSPARGKSELVALKLLLFKRPDVARMEFPKESSFTGADKSREMINLKITSILPALKAETGLTENATKRRVEAVAAIQKIISSTERRAPKGQYQTKWNSPSRVSEFRAHPEVVLILEGNDKLQRSELSRAVLSCSLEKVQQALKTTEDAHGANKPDILGFTPLFYSIHLGLSEITEYIISELNPSPSIILNHNSGETLGDLLKTCSIRLKTTLSGTSHGEPSPALHEECKKIKVAIEECQSQELTDLVLKTPQAAMHVFADQTVSDLSQVASRDEIAKNSIEQKCTLSIATAYFKTKSLVKLAQLQIIDATALAQYLENANPSSLSKQVQFQSNPLSCAAVLDTPVFLSQLLKEPSIRQKYLNSESDPTSSPVFASVLHHKPDSLKLLTKHKANLHYMTHGTETPLHQAILNPGKNEEERECNKQIIEHFVKKMDISIHTEGEELLLLATKNDNLEALQFLLDHGCNKSPLFSPNSKPVFSAKKAPRIAKHLNVPIPPSTPRGKGSRSKWFPGNSRVFRKGCRVAWIAESLQENNDPRGQDSTATEEVKNQKEKFDPTPLPESKNSPSQVWYQGVNKESAFLRRVQEAISRNNHRSIQELVQFPNALEALEVRSSLLQYIADPEAGCDSETQNVIENSLEQTHSKAYPIHALVDRTNDKDPEAQKAFRKELESSPRRLARAINQMDEHNNTPIMIAFKQNKIHIATELLKHDADILPLLSAIEINNIHIHGADVLLYPVLGGYNRNDPQRKLLEQRILWEGRWGIDSPLKWAVDNKKLHLIEYIKNLKKQHYEEVEPVSLENLEGAPWRPQASTHKKSIINDLHEAISSNNQEAIKQIASLPEALKLPDVRSCLLDYRQTDMCDSETRKTLQQCLERSHMLAYPLHKLIRATNDKDSGEQRKFHQDLEHLLRESPRSLNQMDDYGITPLSLALKQDKINTTTELLYQGANILPCLHEEENIRIHEKGADALNGPALGEYERGTWQYDTIQTHLLTGGRWDIPQPLHWAAKNGKNNLVRNLLQAGKKALDPCKVSVRDGEANFIPIQSAIKEGHIDVVRTLLDTSPEQATYIATGNSRTDQGSVLDAMGYYYQNSKNTTTIKPILVDMIKRGYVVVQRPAEVLKLCERCKIFEGAAGFALLVSLEKNTPNPSCAFQAKEFGNIAAEILSQSSSFLYTGGKKTRKLKEELLSIRERCVLTTPLRDIPESTIQNATTLNRGPFNLIHYITRNKNPHPTRGKADLSTSEAWTAPSTSSAGASVFSNAPTVLPPISAPKTLHAPKVTKTIKKSKTTTRAPAHNRALLDNAPILGNPSIIRRSEATDSSDISLSITGLSKKPRTKPGHPKTGATR